jgi:ribonucleoside-diphosphate reductase beta chain
VQSGSRTKKGGIVNIFEKRLAFKPFEYPELIQFKEAVQHSYWLVSEWNFVSDVQDFNTRLTEVERSAVKNTLLAISQIEVSVKKFWAKIGDRFPKAEVDQVGMVFAESEVRHADAYSHLLQVLALNDDFDQLLQEPVIQGRVDYLQKYLKGAADNSNENYTLTLALFAIFIENVSLFSQFLIVKAFNKYKNQLKDIDNVVQATAKEEAIHAQFGVRLIEIVKRENPKWFNDDFYGKLERACKKALVAEEGIIDWIFSDGELPFLPKAVVKWFDEEEATDVSADFFHKKPVTYSKNMQAITEGDLF